MKRFYPSDLYLCHMVLLAVEPKSASGRGGQGVGEGGRHIQIHPSVGHSEGSLVLTLGRLFPQKHFKGKNALV